MRRVGRVVHVRGGGGARWRRAHLPLLAAERCVAPRRHIEGELGVDEAQHVSTRGGDLSGGAPFGLALPQLSPYRCEHTSPQLREGRAEHVMWGLGARRECRGECEAGG